MMRDRVSDKPDAALRRNLFHDGRLSDSRRSHQQNRPLSVHRKAVIFRRVFSMIRLQRMDNLIFCILYIHNLFFPPPCSVKMDILSQPGQMDILCTQSGV